MLCVQQVGLALLAFQALPEESPVGPVLTVIATLIGALGGVITAIGGILVNLERIKSDNEKLRLARDKQLRDLQEEIRLFQLQVMQTTKGRLFIEELERLRVLRDQELNFKAEPPGNSSD